MQVMAFYYKLWPIRGLLIEQATHSLSFLILDFNFAHPFAPDSYERSTPNATLVNAT